MPSGITQSGIAPSWKPRSISSFSSSGISGSVAAPSAAPKNAITKPRLPCRK